MLKFPTCPKLGERGRTPILLSKVITHRNSWLSFQARFSVFKLMAAWKLVYQRLNHKSFPKPFSENQMNTGTNESGVLVKENDKFNPVRKTSQRHAMVVCPETRMIRRTDEGFGWKKTQISILYRKNSPSPDPPNAPLMPPTLSHCIVVAP